MQLHNAVDVVAYLKHHMGRQHLACDGARRGVCCCFYEMKIGDVNKVDNSMLGQWKTHKVFIRSKVWVWIRYLFVFKTCLVFASFAPMARMAHETMRRTLLHLPLSIWNLVMHVMHK
jgi:hypothetical protein